MKEDRIVYLAVTNGGGMDGMDHTDKGGKIMRAGFCEADAPLSPWTHLEKVVIEMEQAKREALHKLTPLDKLVLCLEEDKK